ncbi:hypothetical protein Cgig2_001329 [Carnegiea gigantea]|uniref:Uncharacterized protein n=1 Tax=Carnegiea gigantea TaxID=171969 RepID=A0A9Q1KVK2_9CARY|nr:hypothetical protein Cgig2_001329 [Carnegiea gigantea]
MAKGWGSQYSTPYSGGYGSWGYGDNRHGHYSHQNQSDGWQNGWNCYQHHHHQDGDHHHGKDGWQKGWDHYQQHDGDRHHGKDGWQNGWDQADPGIWRVSQMSHRNPRISGQSPEGRGNDPKKTIPTSKPQSGARCSWQGVHSENFDLHGQKQIEKQA